VDLDVGPRWESATKLFEIRRRGPRARSKDGVDVYVAVQLKVRDNVDVDVNLNDARSAARLLRSFDRQVFS
jgi:hypothetical protein